MPFDIQSMAANAIGSKIGNAAGNKIAESLKNQLEKKEQASVAKKSPVKTKIASSHDAAREEVIAFSQLDDFHLQLPGKKYGNASYELSEMNRRKTSFWNGAKEVLVEGKNALIYTVNHPREVAKALVLNLEDNLDAYQNANFFKSRSQMLNQNTSQSFSNIYYDVRNENYGSLGHATAELAINFAPVGKVFGAVKFGVFARVAGKEVEIASFTPKVGDKIYRVWGDEAESQGRSWTRIDPGAIADYRNKAGLPDQNTGRFVSEGYLKNTEGVTQRSTISLHGNVGGLDEVIVPNPKEQIELTRVSGANRPF